MPANEPTSATHLAFTPDEDIHVHEEGAINLICKPFQSHEQGLPEWVKNASDEYARTDAPESQRIIIVIFDKGNSEFSKSISVLDFSGMTSNIIENNFRQWADPDASLHGNLQSQVQGGHGNGGKCYMTMMFDEYAMIHTLKDNKRNLYGANSGSVRFGYSEKNTPVSDVTLELSQALSKIGCTFDSLPPHAVEALQSRQGFTLVTGRSPKGYTSRIPVTKLIESLIGHPQMIHTLSLCEVYVVSNGTLGTDAAPLRLKDIPPDPAFNEPRQHTIPNSLVDPDTNHQIATRANDTDEPGILILRTSETDMKRRNKPRHVMIYHGQSGFIGYTPMNELGVHSSFISRIYGECRLAALESAKQNDREALANSPLTRAVRHFISEKVEEIVKDFEERERRSYDQKEKDGLSHLNQILDQWKNRFISQYVSQGGGEDGDGPSPPPPPLPIGTPARIQIGLSNHRSGIGVSFRPLIRFFDKNERRIRPVPFQWISDDTNVAWVDPDLNIVHTFTAGKTTILAETLDGKVRSNEIPLEVVRVLEIELSPSVIQVEAGSRQAIAASCVLADKTHASDVALVWTEDNPDVARVSASGSVYGHNLGTTKITAGDNSCEANNEVVVTVIEGSGGHDPGHGRGYPKILVSSIDSDPDTDHDVNLSYDDPPVHQRPQDIDRNIWWINSSAPLAKIYLDRELGYGHESREWRIYHIERYIEVIAQIRITLDSDSDSLDSSIWILRWGEYVSDIQVEAATTLYEFIDAGVNPF